MATFGLPAPSKPLERYERSRPLVPLLLLLAQLTITQGAAGGVSFQPSDEPIDHYEASISLPGSALALSTVNLGKPAAVDGRITVAVPAIAKLPLGTYTVVVWAVNAKGERSGTAPSDVFTIIVAPPVLPACVGPLGAEAVAVYVTNWQIVGRDVRVNFQLFSNSPITSVQALVNGLPVGEPIAGRAAGGLWFPRPAAGSYKLTVRATNGFGCTRTVFAPDLVIP